MIFAGVSTIIAATFLPETYAPVILLKKVCQKTFHRIHTSDTSSLQTLMLRKSDSDKNHDIYAQHELGDWSLSGLVHRTLFRPFEMLFKEPILVLITIYLSLIYGILYCRKVSV